MIIQASNGCFLTEAFEVAIKDRRFLKSISMADMEEAALWKEVTEIEKEQMIDEGKFFEPERVDFNFLQRFEKLEKTIPDMINDAALSPDEALAVTKYYPQWEDKIGYEAQSGYRVQYQGVLVEVVTPHVLSTDINPSQQPMLLNTNTDVADSLSESSLSAEAGLDTDIESDNVNIPTVYFKAVEPSRITLEEPVKNVLEGQ